MVNPSIHRLLDRFQVKRDNDTDVNAWVHKDTRPLPPSRRTYGPWNFVGLWLVTGSFNVGGWATGSSLISLGLNVWQSMLVVIIANVFVGFMCLWGGAPGAQWHVGFPYFQRSIWGVRGGYWPLMIRVFLSFVYMATNSWYGGQCVKVFLTALWPSFAHLDTELAGGTMDTADMVSFIIFLAMCVPLMWISPERYRIPFMISVCTVVPTVFILMIWSMVRAGGGGSLLSNAGTVSGVQQAEGSHLGWMFLYAIMANIGSSCTHTFSQADYTRYARKPRDQVLAQLIMVPLGSIVVGLIGIICASCIHQIYPETKTLLWQPYKFLDAILTYETGNISGARAGVAFASISFILSQFGITVASNAVVAGIDLAALLPRWFTIRRGGYCTMVFVFIMQPWQLLNSATSFLTVVGSFSVFLAPFMGIMVSDYYWLRYKSLKLTDLYEISPKSIYWYWHGVNWRAAIAWVIPVALLMPGFIVKIQHPKEILTGWTNLYWISFLFGSVVAGGLYMALDFIWPMEHKGAVDDEDYFGTFTESPIINGVSDRSSGASVQENKENAKALTNNVVEV